MGDAKKLNMALTFSDETFRNAANELQTQLEMAAKGELAIGDFTGAGLLYKLLRNHLELALVFVPMDEKPEVVELADPNDGELERLLDEEGRVLHEDHLWHDKECRFCLEEIQGEE